MTAHCVSGFGGRKSFALSAPPAFSGRRFPSPVRIVFRAPGEGDRSGIHKCNKFVHLPDIISQEFPDVNKFLKTQSHFIKKYGSLLLNPLDRKPLQWQNLISILLHDLRREAPDEGLFRSPPPRAFGFYKRTDCPGQKSRSRGNDSFGKLWIPVSQSFPLRASTVCWMLLIYAFSDRFCADA